MQLIAALLSVLAGLAFVSLATASPIADAAVVKRSVATDKFTVEVTAPASGDFWVSPFNNTVKWDTSTIPLQAKTDTASIIIGYYDVNNISHLYDPPLATGFQLSSGNQVITTPNVTSVYYNFVVLFDISSDMPVGMSQTFTIAQ